MVELDIISRSLGSMGVDVEFETLVCRLQSAGTEAMHFAACMLFAYLYTELNYMPCWASMAACIGVLPCFLK